MIDVGLIWEQVLQHFIDEGRAEGWTPYYVNIMFRALRGKPDAILQQMETSLHKEFYTRFMMRFVRGPHRVAEQERMPRMMLSPDSPVYKQVRASDRTTSMNADGLHYNGAVLIPPVSRFVGCPIAHIDEHQFGYVRGNIARIQFDPVDHRTRRLSSYIVKTVARAHRFKCSAADESRILILPKSLSEVRRNKVELPPHEKAIKDIQASLNVSDELADKLTSALQTCP